MANLVRYYFRKLGANFVDFKLDYPNSNLSLIGSDVVYVGSSGVDRVYVAKGVKFTFNNSGTGIDEIYLGGSLADYTSTAIGTSTLLLTSASKANTTITLASEDKVFFSDGSTSVKSLINYAASSTPFTLNTTENSLTLPSTNNLDSILRAYTKDPAGVVFAQPHAGVEFILTGHNGVDKVYVSKGGKVNANNLGTGVDLIYLTGSKNEYSPTAVGTSVLVLTKGTERVTLASEDRVIFADGSTLVKAAITAASGANWQALSLDSNTRTPGLVTDTQAPAMPTLALGAGVSGGATAAEATAATGVVSVLAESGSTVLLTFSDSASPMHTLLKTVIGTGSALAVTLQSGDIGSGAAQLQDGSITISATATDAAGNTSTAGTASFTLDTLAPSINASSFAVNENTQAVGTATLSNADSVTWALAGNGADNALFAIDPASGAITWLAASGPDFEAATQSAAGSNSYTLSVSATDAAGKQSTQAISVQLLDVNEAPVNVLPAALAVNEDTPLAITGISVSDVDAGSNGIASVQLSVVEGTLSVMADAAPGGLAAASISGNNSNSLTLTGNQAAINATLASLSYQGRLNFHGTDTLTVQTSDGASPALSSSNSVSISINSVNDAPTISGIPANTVWAFVSSVTNLDDFRVADVDSSTLYVTIIPFNGTIEGLSPGTSAGLTTSIDNNGTILLTGTADAINSKLATIRFRASAVGNARIDVDVSDVGPGDSTSHATGSYHFLVTYPPELSIASGQDAILNSRESSLTVQLAMTGLASGDSVQLKLDGSNLGSAYSITAADIYAGKASLTISKSSLGSDGSKAISAVVTHYGAELPASNTLNLTLDTVAPTLDLNSTTPGTGTITYILTTNATTFNSNTRILPSVAPITDADVLKIKLQFDYFLNGDHLKVGSIGATEQDLDLNSTINITATGVSLGSVTGVDYTYTASLLTLSKTDGSAFTGSTIAGLLAELQLKNASATSGLRSFAVHLIDIAGNDTVAYGLAVIGLPVSVLSIDSGQDAILNSAESSLTVQLAMTGLDFGDSVQLKLDGSNLGSAYSVTAADVYAAKASLTISKSSLGSDGSKAISAVVTHYGAELPASNTLNLTLDTVAPTLDLNSTTPGTGTITYILTTNATTFNSNTRILPSVAPITDADVLKITLQFDYFLNGDHLKVGSIGATEQDLDLNSTINITATGVSLGSVTGLDYTYAAATHLLTLSKTDGSAFTDSTIAGLLAELQLKNAFATSGRRNFAVHLIDIAGNDTLANGQAVISPPVPVLSIDSGQDAILNSAESSLTVQLAMTGLASGDSVQLKLDGSNLGSAYSVTAADISAGKASLTISKSSLGSDGSKAISAVVTHYDEVSPASNTLNLTLDTVAPTLDLNSTTPGTDTYTSILTTNATTFNSNTRILPSVAPITDADVLKITLDFRSFSIGDHLKVGSIGATEQDLDLNSLSNITATGVSLGSVTGVDYTYTASLLTLSKTDGSAFTGSTIAGLLAELQLKNASATSGLRSFDVHLIDIAGNDTVAYGSVVI